MFSLVLCVLVPAMPVFSQEQTTGRSRSIDNSGGPGDWWISPGAELVLFTVEGFAYGGGAALGYGRGMAIGLKAAWFVDDKNELSTLELGFLLRWYFFGSDSYSGPYLQLNAGPAIFVRTGEFTVPSEWGTICAGLTLGWRFLLGNRWFVEPAIRGGYPYIAGLGVFAGVCF